MAKSNPTDPKWPDNPNGYCPSCKKDQERVALCDECAGQRGHTINTQDGLRKQNEIKEKN